MIAASSPDPQHPGRRLGTWPRRVAGTQTYFYGGGNDAEISATALATYALLSAGGNKDTVDKALAYLAGTRDSMGNFGSTQATIWTLRALLLAASKGGDGPVGSLDVR